MLNQSACPPPFCTYQVWAVLYTVLVTDTLIRLLSALPKLLVVVLYQKCSHSPKRLRQEAQVLTLIEYMTLTYRALLPAPVWYVPACPPTPCFPAPCCMHTCLHARLRRASLHPAACIRTCMPTYAVLPCTLLHALPLGLHPAACCHSGLPLMLPLPSPYARLPPPCHPLITPPPPSTVSLLFIITLTCPSPHSRYHYLLHSGVAPVNYMLTACYLTLKGVCVWGGGGSPAHLLTQLLTWARPGTRLMAY